MKNYKFIKKICALALTAAMSAGIFPAGTALNAMAEAQPYTSVYPDRISDDIVFEDLESESYQTGQTAIQLGVAHFPAGNQENAYVILDEVDSNKLLYYEGQHNYSTFTTPGIVSESGNIWVDVDIKLPAYYADYRFQFGDSSYADRAQLIFYKENTRVVASNVQDPDGGVKTLTLSENVPQEEWFTLSLWINTVDERFRVYINGVQQGEEMNLYHKFDYVKNGTEKQEAFFSKMSFAHRDSNKLEGEFNSRIYLDNMRIGYARKINPVETMEITIDKGEEFSFPEKLSLSLDDTSIRDFKVEFTPVGEVLDVNTLGSYEYTASIENYPEPVTVWVYVKDRQIASIEKIYEKAYKDENYSLPSVVNAIMDDGSTKEVAVVWNGTADVSNTGTFEFTGTVEGYSEQVLLNLQVLANAVLRADDLYIGVAQGDEYVMPTEHTVIMTNHKYEKASVSWEAGAESIDTSVLGKHEFTGTVEGYNDPIKLYVTVYKDDPDLSYVLDVLTEYYDNILTIGRDRSQWFPEEYAAGYDPATPDIISDNPHSPIPSMGINRDTNYHAEWPAVTEKMPLCVPTTQGPLWKGLQGMTAITGDPKYHEAVEEAHGYITENFVSESSKMLLWGDHILQQFNHPTLAIQNETDSYSYGTHQLECDYPEFDILFSQNPEVAENYIKAFWVGHFNGQKKGIMLNTMEFSRHASTSNSFSNEVVANVFKPRYDIDEAVVHKVSGALTFVNAAVDYAWAAVKLWQNTGDEDALHYARKILECYHIAADPTTGLIPFMYNDTGGSVDIGDVYDEHWSWSSLGRARSSYSKVYNNPEKYGTTVEKIQDSWLLNQGKCGGGSFYYPMICFDIADVVGGEIGAEIEQWGIEALKGFCKYTYDHRTGLGKSGMTDGTVLDDYKPEYKAYYAQAGRAQFPFTITSDMSWVVLDGYERTNDPEMWEVLRSICMSFSVGDIGTAPGENVDLDIYTDCNDTNIILTLSRLYEITGNDDYFQLAKRIVKQTISDRFINGFFYKEKLSQYARFSDPTAYCILYFLAASEGRSKMIPHYMGESFDFQTNYKQDNGDIDSLYGYSLFNKLIVSEVLASAVICDVDEIELSVGEQYVINAEVFPDNADDISLEWDTDNLGCCIVEDGYVTAIAPGTCIITAEASSGVSKDIKVTVK